MSGGEKAGHAREAKHRQTKNAGELRSLGQPRRLSLRSQFLQEPDWTQLFAHRHPAGVRVCGELRSPNPSVTRAEPLRVFRNQESLSTIRNLVRPPNPHFPCIPWKCRLERI